MPPSSSKPLTDRQRAVMVRVDRRVPIKVIAQELGVSETRINQHIRALKDIYGAGSLGDLVQCYRATLSGAGHEEKSPNGATVPSEELSAVPLPKSVGASDLVRKQDLSESTYSKNQLPVAKESIDSNGKDELGNLTFNDVMPLVEKAPWLGAGEPKVVPGVLDGEHATLARFGAIIFIAFGFLAAVVLMATAAMTISEALEGKASISEDEQGQT